MSSPPAPSWPDQGGNIVVINGGASQDRIQIAGDNPIVFPDFSTGTPPVVTLGGWSGPPPGPPAGTGLVTPSGPPTSPYTPPAIGGDDRATYIARCITDVMGQGADEPTAEELCSLFWDAENPATRAAQPARRRRK